MPKYQASEFASGLKYAKILNMAKLCTWQYSQYAETATGGFLKNFANFTRKHLVRVSF